MNFLEWEAFVFGCQRGCAGVVAGYYVADTEVVVVSVVVLVAVSVSVSGVWRLPVLHPSRCLL